MKFELGRTVMTRGIDEEIKKNADFYDFAASCLLFRHAEGDWGDMCEEDAKANDDALKNGDRIFSSYKLPEGLNVEGEDKIWIITEWDRSVTTILFPSEY